ncbi:unnamed protein product [Penicillium discolor]
MLGMSFKPLHTNLPDLSARADLKSPISNTSERPTQLDTATDTAIMSDTCTETKSSPSILTDPSAEGNHDLTASISTQCDTVIENVIMPETATATEPKSPPTDLFSPRALENIEAGTSDTWNMPTQYESDSDSDIQTVILSSQKDPSTTPNASSGDPSSGTKLDTSSIDSLDTNPESPPSALFNTSAYENSESKTSTTPDVSTQYDSDSDVQTVLLCDDTSENEANTPQNLSSNQEELNTISSTPSDDSPDDSSDDSSVGSSSGSSNSSSGAKSESSSVESVDTSPKCPHIALFNPSSQENCEFQTSTTSEKSTQYDSDSDSDVQTVIMCDNPFENEANTPQNSSSSQKEHDTKSSTSSGHSSDDSSAGSSSGSSDSSSAVKSESSPFDGIDTSPKSPHIALFDPSSQDNCEFQTSTTSEKSTRYDSDSDSDVQTVVLCDDTSQNDTNTLQNSSSSQKEPDAIPSTSSDDCSDDSSVGSSSWASDSSCGAKSESSSIDSFDTSSRHDSESEEEEPPKGSQILAAYASPLRDRQRIRTSCDSIHDPGRWQVDPDGFINEKYRAGGPFLCSLPETILNLKGSSPLMAVLENISLHKMIFSVLEEYQVNASSIKIKRCQYEFWPILQPLATLIITATRDTFSDDWVQACREIWRRLSEHELGHINVEISDPTLHNPFNFWPVEKNHPYFLKHMDVMERITNELHLKDLLNVGAFRMATTSDVKDSEVFMSLTVNFKSELDWRGPREQIVSILEELKLPMVGVVVQKGKMWGGSWS